MKLALGSVQFGLDYGISNTTGKVSTSEVYQLLDSAWQAGITAIDTASSYGDSEKILGNYQSPRLFNYLGKISPECPPDRYIEEAEQSIKDLNIKSFEAISVHHGSILLKENGLAHYQALAALKTAGMTNKIGCSVYSPAEAIELLNQYPLDMIQLPASIFDQRIFDEQFISFIQEKNVELHIRSIFLQGAVFLSQRNVPDILQRLSPKLALLERLSLQYKTSKLALIMAPFANNPSVDKIIIGCVSKAQLEENLAAYHTAKSLNIDLSELAIDDETILNPSKW
ncbi:hypothetical protein HII17_15200 [Thalassotalea sp. M1531]|uniref:NADP-dependent oxidoreductase domain-containing protein n=1 Tax=Thalassotalea algicola TaxID=2716224 RepID=A0A7Y0LER2_9GAMM|nr:aldo/keto reductase [Thalassotalea algicola]NMP32903.1 hypothetical protein [Thalassotalea algicola]